MAHNLMIDENNNGFFNVGEKTWHGLGHKLQNPPTVQEAIILAGLDYEVGLKNLYAPLIGDKLIENFSDNIMQAVSSQATYRKDTNHILGVVGKNYTPVQNIDAFDFFNPFIENNLATLETAGCLDDGKKLFITAKINMPDMMIVNKANDSVQAYVMLSNSHDGTTALRVGFTPIRVVCANTLALAHKNSGSKLLRIRHTKNSGENLANIRETMNLIKQEFEATSGQYKKLATMDINQADIEKFVKQVFSLKDDRNTDDEQKEDKKRLIAKITELSEIGIGNNVSGVYGTRWALYNAFAEYLQYYRGKSKEKRFESLHFGDAERLNRKGLEILLTM